jgi:hypothetical protein
MRTHSISLIVLILSFPLFFACGSSSTESVEEVSVIEIPKMEGSWQMVSLNGQPVQDEIIKLFTSGFFAYTHAAAPDNAYVAAGGGWYRFEDGEMVQKMAFYTQDSSRVGNEYRYSYQVDGNRVTLEGLDGLQVWEKMSDRQDDLTGTWRMLGRQNAEGGLDQRRPVAARITVKVLAGGRFQWAAINTETGQFFGTGAGYYTAENGEYVENIRVFSRDKTRVGASLPFTYEIKGEENDWYHSGFSSTGDPLGEIWGIYNK